MASGSGDVVRQAFTGKEEFDVLYKSGELLLVDKPPDVAIDGDHDWTVEKYVRKEHAELLQGEGRKLRFCHQLDFATSGILCLAFTKAMAARFGHCFQMRTSQKVYLALVHGHPEEDVASFTGPVAEDPTDPTGFKMCIGRLAAPAEKQAKPPAAPESSAAAAKRRKVQPGEPGACPLPGPVNPASGAGIETPSGGGAGKAASAPGRGGMQPASADGVVLAGRAVAADGTLRSDANDTQPSPAVAADGTLRSDANDMQPSPAVAADGTLRSDANDTQPSPAVAADGTLRSDANDMQPSPAVAADGTLRSDANDMQPSPAVAADGTLRSDANDPVRIPAMQPSPADAVVLAGQVAAADSTLRSDANDPVRSPPTQPSHLPVGRPATTRAVVLKRGRLSFAPAVACSLVALFPHTGRRHQLRVHCLSWGHPIVGDVTYRPADKSLAIPRMMLHAWKLSLPVAVGDTGGAARLELVRQKAARRTEKKKLERQRVVVDSTLPDDQATQTAEQVEALRLLLLSELELPSSCAERVGDDGSPMLDLRAKNRFADFYQDTVPS
ncbi:Ribosomal large subunit pseudouridine synthase D [Diplonema papillatum]|nr:Ribosomal large subunit pseudouridine synthase D [Diplonema papillatum]